MVTPPRPFNPLSPASARHKCPLVQLCVGVALVAGVAGWFELEGGVFDADGEVLADSVLESIEKVIGLAVVEALVVHDDVGGEDR